MMEILEITDANDVVIGTYECYSHLRRIYSPTGEFKLADGRRYDLRYVPKYYRNVNFN